MWWGGNSRKIARRFFGFRCCERERRKLFPTNSHELRRRLKKKIWMICWLSCPPLLEIACGDFEFIWPNPLIFFKHFASIHQIFRRGCATTAPKEKNQHWISRILMSECWRAATRVSNSAISTCAAKYRAASLSKPEESIWRVNSNSMKGWKRIDGHHMTCSNSFKILKSISFWPMLIRQCHIGMQRMCTNCWRHSVRTREWNSWNVSQSYD